MSLFDMAPTQKLAGHPTSSRQDALVSGQKALHATSRPYSHGHDLGWRALDAAS